MSYEYKPVADEDIDGSKNAGLIPFHQIDLGLELRSWANESRGSRTLPDLPRSNPSPRPRTSGMSSRSRLVRLGIFVILELLWIALAVFVHFRVVGIPYSTQSIGLWSLKMSRDELFKSGLSTLTIVWHLMALVPISAIMQETFAGEWYLRLNQAHFSIESDCKTDRVSTLTFGFIEQIRHVVKDASWRYSVAFAVIILTTAFSAVAPGSITTVMETVSTHSDVGLSIGKLDPNQTAFALNAASKEDERVRLRNSLLYRALYISSASNEKTTTGFQLASNNSLFGMPPSSFLGERLSYRSDAVFYNFSCQWLAPNITFSTNTTNWMFKAEGDIMGTLEYSYYLLDNDIDNTVGVDPNRGISSLILESGNGSRNGSFAWLVIGGLNFSAPDVDLSSIPNDHKVNNLTLPLYADYLVTTAAVLFCDPQMEFGVVEVELQSHMLNAVRVEGADSVGAISNLDRDETSRMLGSSLNMFPEDPDNLANDLILLPPPDNTTAVFTLQSLSNISASLNWYATIVGASVFLDGTLGSTNTSMQLSEDIYRVEWNWAHLLLTISIAFAISLLTAFIIYMERAGTDLVIALSVVTAHSAAKHVALTSNPALVMSHRSRVTRILAFVILELIWLIFGLLTQLCFIKPSTSNSFMKLSQSSVSSIGIIWQLMAAIPVLSITTETFSGEWAYTHSSSPDILIKDGNADAAAASIENISTLTSGFLDRGTCFWSGRASCRFKLAFIISLLTMALKIIAPGSISTGIDTIYTDIQLQIGSIPPSFAFDVEMQRSTTRLAYLAMIEDIPLNYQIANKNVLFGMPNQSMLSSQLQYQTEAVFFDFDCHWTAPTFLYNQSEKQADTAWLIDTKEGSIFGVSQAFISDRVASHASGVFALESNRDSLNGLNGIFAWLLIGGDSADFEPVVPMNFSAFPEADVSYNASGYYGVEEGFGGEGHLTNASVLLCNPNMELGFVEVTLNNHIFSASRIHGNNEDVGSTGTILDRNMIEIVICAGLNGLPSDAVPAYTNDSVSVSRLAFELALQRLSPESLISPQPLSNISENLNWFTSVIGANAYFEGSLGNTTNNSAQSLEEVQRFICSWTHWIATVAIVILTTILLAALIHLEAPGTRPIVPLTLTSVLAVAGVAKSESTGNIGDELGEFYQTGLNTKDF